MRILQLIFILVLLLLGGCRDSTPTMPLSERQALECKTRLETLAQVYSSEEILTEERLKRWSYYGPRKCPTGADSYEESIKAACGKPGKDLVLYCAGEHHALAGWPKNYPQWSDGKVVENPEGEQSIPSGFSLQLPDDAKIKETKARQGEVILVVASEQNFEELAKSYNKTLNPQTELVLAAYNGVQSVKGKINHLPYTVILDSPRKTIEFRWDPLVDVNF